MRMESINGKIFDLAQVGIGFGEGLKGACTIIDQTVRLGIEPQDLLQCLRSNLVVLRFIHAFQSDYASGGRITRHHPTICVVSYSGCRFAWAACTLGRGFSTLHFHLLMTINHKRCDFATICRWKQRAQTKRLVEVKVSITQLIINDNGLMHAQRFQLPKTHEVEQCIAMKFVKLRQDVSLSVFMHSPIRMRDCSTREVATKEQLLMILQVLDGESFLGVDKERIISEIFKTHCVDFLAMFPTIVVAIACSAISGSALLLFMHDVDRSIQCVKHSINISMVTKSSRATEADTVLKRSGELLQGGSPHCIY